MEGNTMNIAQGGINPFMHAKKAQGAGMAKPVQPPPPPQNVSAPQGMDNNIKFMGSAPQPGQGGKLNTIA
jgi:hypothetical protein